ncbi:hypothetical protein [Hyphomonas sp.]|uniref:hypothetical protein n=1 Tax=Hyphomonas sp. TaxID=87 RepID=UPI000C89BACF|nr:hypothetical protein [Hyphomonas sp.]MAL47091.1 hypothetical protein [Hyphomonas sp.]|tara:strand:+ start:6327 stop:7295 length:969 start_codon:yes stop_codon:yes gene_type:complete
MITVYKVDENGQILSIQIEKNQLTQYENLGWTTTKPVDVLGAIEGDGKKGQDIEFSGPTTTATPSPYGYPALVPDGRGGFIDASVYLNGINENGNWYYPGSEDVILDSLTETEIKNLQDRLVRTQWFTTESYGQEYGRPGRETRNALIKAMTASNFEAGVGYDYAIDLELLNPGQEIFVPRTYRASDRATRLQTVDAIFKSLGIEPTDKRRNKYSLLLENLEKEEFATDETIRRMEVQGPEVTKTVTTKAGIDPDTEKPKTITEVKETVEPIPGQFDAQARLIEKVKTDFAGYLERQDDVAKLKTNVANISNSVMRLKGLGG